jgi:hypothetical protein
MHSAVSLPGEGKKNYRETKNKGLAAPLPTPQKKKFQAEKSGKF